MSNNNNINISINDSTVSINDINLLNTSQVIQLINSSIDKFVGIQNNTFAETSGIELSNLFDGNMNGNYYQMNTACKLGAAKSHGRAYSEIRKNIRISLK